MILTLTLLSIKLLNPLEPNAQARANDDLVTTKRLASKREAFGPDNGLPLPFAYLEGASSGTMMMFPFGGYERRYQWSGAAGESFLNCQLKRHGKIVGTWSIRLKEVRRPAKGWHFGNQSLNGTLVRYLASQGIEPAEPIPSVAVKALQAHKCFAAYRLHFMTEEFSWWAVTPDGSIVEKGTRPRVGDSTKVSAPYLGAPYNITKMESQWLIRTAAGA
ncbi:MAG: hypothetical protein ABL949_13095 [Fimbriimonadaceae bacterium]